MDQGYLDKRYIFCTVQSIKPKWKGYKLRSDGLQHRQRLISSTRNVSCKLERKGPIIQLKSEHKKEWAV